MLKRTIVVLAALSMLVALLPAVALAAAGTVDTTNVTVKQGATKVVSGVTVTVVTVDADKVKPTNTTGAPTATLWPVTMGTGDFDGNNATADTTPPTGTAATVIVTVTATGVTYYFPVTLTEAGSTGIAEVTVNLPTAGSLSGSVKSDVAATSTDLVIGQDGGGSTLTAGAPVSIYKSNVLWATLTTSTTGGTFTAIVGAGSFTVATDVTGLTDTPAGTGTSTTLIFGGTNTFASATTINTDADACDTAAGCVTTPTDIDEGEVMWFSSKATATAANVIVVTGAENLSGVNFLYANAATSRNLKTLDHIDVQQALFFTDMLAHWAETEAAALRTAGVVAGCTTTTFCPEADITRAEFAVMLSRAYSSTVTVVTTAPFPDVPATYWAAGHIAKLKTLKIVEGEGGSFNPEAPISRSEAVAMLARAAFLKNGASSALAGKTWEAHPSGTLATNAAPTTSLTIADLPAATLSFVDVPTSYWAAREITWMFLGGVVKGNAGAFSPEANLSRAEMAAILYRAMNN